MKKIVSVFVAIMMVLSLLSVPVFADEDIKVIVNGEKITFDAAPYIENGRTMVPMRAIFEALGAEVLWDAENYAAQATDGVDTIGFCIGDSQISETAFTARRKCEVSPKIVNDRTFIPLRAIGESFDCNVEWDDITKTVYVDEKKLPVDVTYKTEQIVLDTAHETAKVVVNYSYPEVTDGKDFISAENVKKLNQMITQQRTGLVDVYTYAATFSEEWKVLIEEQPNGVTLDFVTKLYTSEKYGTVSIMTGVNMPWTGGELESITMDNTTLTKKELHECFTDKEPNALYSEIYDNFVKNYEDVRYGKEELEVIPGVVPFVVSDDDLRVYMSHLLLGGVGRVNGFYTVVNTY